MEPEHTRSHAAPAPEARVPAAARRPAAVGDPRPGIPRPLDGDHPATRSRRLPSREGGKRLLAFSLADFQVVREGSAS